MEELPVAGYFRVSQARDDMKAPALYRDDIARYCSYRNLTVGHVFADIDYSGYRGAKARPALEELKLRRHECSAAVVPKLSRFGRSVKDLVGLFDLFDRDGIALHFLDMNLDTSTSQGRLLRHIMAAFAEYESDVKSDYAKATQRMIVREGRPHGPIAPYGYTYIGTKSERNFAIDEPAAEIVRELFAGRSVTAMARDLNERGLTGPRGGEWTRQRVKTILDNPVYAGFRRHDGDEFPGIWPAVVTREDFDSVRRSRHQRRTTYNDPAGFRRHLLSGLIRRGICGRNLHFAKFGKRQSAYRCTKGVSKPPVCLGGTIGAARAEKLVTDAFFDSVEAAGDIGEFRRRWVEADDRDRGRCVRRIKKGWMADKTSLFPTPFPEDQNARCRRAARSIDRTSSGEPTHGYFCALVGSHRGSTGPHEFDCRSIQRELAPVQSSTSELNPCTDTMRHSWHAP